MLEKYNVCNSGGPSILEKEGTNPRDGGANLLFGKNFAKLHGKERNRTKSGEEGGHKLSVGSSDTGSWKYELVFQMIQKYTFIFSTEIQASQR